MFSATETSGERHGHVSNGSLLSSTKPMQNAVIRFFDENETWLEAVLIQGQEEGALAFVGSASDAARMIVSALEGAMLVSRPYADPARFQATAARLFASLTRSSSATELAGSR